MKARHQRLVLIAVGMLLLAGAVALVLKAMSENMEYFRSPSEIVTGQVPKERTVRVGGMVVGGSIKRDGLNVSFEITDTASTVPVVYSGSLPDLFKEGKGAVVKGRVEADGVFHATEVLAKHDENYMPPEAAHAVEFAQKAQATMAEAEGKKAGAAQP